MQAAGSVRGDFADMETRGRDADRGGCGQPALQSTEESALNARGVPDEARRDPRRDFGEGETVGLSGVT